MISNLRLLIPYGANKEEYWRYISRNTKLAVMPILPILRVYESQDCFLYKHRKSLEVSNQCSFLQACIT